MKFVLIVIIKWSFYFPTFLKQKATGYHHLWSYLFRLLKLLFCTTSCPTAPPRVSKVGLLWSLAPLPGRDTRSSGRPALWECWEEVARLSAGRWGAEEPQTPAGLSPPSPWSSSLVWEQSWRWQRRPLDPAVLWVLGRNQTAWTSAKGKVMEIKVCSKVVLQMSWEFVISTTQVWKKNAQLGCFWMHFLLKEEPNKHFLIT